MCLFTLHGRLYCIDENSYTMFSLSKMFRVRCVQYSLIIRFVICLSNYCSICLLILYFYISYWPFELLVLFRLKEKYIFHFLMTKIIFLVKNLFFFFNLFVCLFGVKEYRRIIVNFTWQFYYFGFNKISIFTFSLYVVCRGK